MSQRARDLLGKLVLALGSIAFVLLAAETALRAAGYRAERFGHPTRVANVKGREIPWGPPATPVFASRGFILALDCLPSNPRNYYDIDLRDPEILSRYRDLAVRNLERTAGAPFAAEFRYNSLGFRDAEFGPRKPGVHRVVVLGDSFTEGQGTKERDTYVRVLETLLNAEEPRAWEVFNLGHRNADFPELFRMFELALSLGPDIVLYGMNLNDAEQSQRLRDREPHLNNWILDRRRWLEGPPPPLPGFFHLRLLDLVAEDIEVHRVGRETTSWYRDMYGEPNRRGWLRTKRYLRSMDARSREAGARLLVALWPLLVGLDGDYPFAGVHDTIRRFHQKAGIPFHDLLPALRGRPPASLWVHPVDFHPNDIAHRLAARSLAPVVRALARP